MLKFKNLNFKIDRSLSESLSANVLEALIGAIYLDSNYQRCEKIITKIFSKLINSEKLLSGKDSKTQLQEYLQSKNLELPIYKKSKLKSPDHNPKFKISCEIPLLKTTISAVSRTVKEGEQMVAEKILNKIIHE